MPKMGGSMPEDRQDPLRRACASGSLDELKRLVAQGHDAHATDEWQRTLLHVAVEHGALDTIAYLVEEASVDVLAIDQFGESLLHVAVRRGELSVVEYLLDKGVDEAPLLRCPNRSSMGHAAQKFDNCPEDVFVLAARHASMEVVAALMAKGFKLDPQNKHQRPLVSAAITRGDVEMLDLFARSGFSLFATDAFGTSMMALAAKHGSPEVLDYFINQGVYEDGYTLLRAAVEGDRLENIKALAALRLNLHATDRHAKTLLHVAVEKAQHSVIEYLLNKHVDSKAVTTQGKTLLHSAVERGDLTILTFLVRRGVVKIQDADKTDNSLLCLAVRSDSTDVLKFLIDAGIDVVASTDQNGYSPIHLAVWRDNLDMVQVLETNGLLVSACDSVDKPILRLAIAHASLPLIKHLVDKGLDLKAANEGRACVIMDADGYDLDEDTLYLKSLGREVTENDAGRYSLLHAAAQRGDLSVVKYLVYIGQDIHAIDRLGRSLLHLATMEDSYDVVEYLLGLGVTPCSVDKKGKTPVHHAVRQGNLKILELLVGNGVDLVAVDKTGPSLLPKAVKRSHYLVIDYLLRNGLTMEAVDKDGNSLMTIAVSSASKRMVTYLINHGFELNKDGDVLLFIAVENHDMDLLEYLVTNGLNPATCDDEGNSLLHTAIRQHVPPSLVNLKLISYLCAMKIDPSSVNRQGNTALHIACEIGDLETAKLLLENGAGSSVTTRNNDGDQPLHIACRGWDSALVRVLLDAGANHDSTIIGLTLVGNNLSVGDEELAAMYKTARTLCEYGATWTDKCDTELTALSVSQPEILLSREWSYESSLSSGQVSTSSAGDFEYELQHALEVRRGIRLCVRDWNIKCQLNGTESLRDVPLEILSRGERAVETYLAAVNATSDGELRYRRKVCVAGPSKAGKTSLVRSLLASQPQLASEGDRTIGIELGNYSFVEESETSVRCHDVALWDFAGDDVYRVTHPLFFSRQTLYFVCIDLGAYAKALKAAEQGPPSSERHREAKLSRYVEHNVFKWLRLIYARQIDAEIVFVGTKADQLGEDMRLLGEIQSDLRLRLRTMQRKWVREVDESFSKLPSPRVSRSDSASHRTAHVNQTKVQVEKLLKADWLVVSSVTEDSVENARQAVEGVISRSPCAFPLPTMYNQALQVIETKRDAAVERLDGKERIESVITPVHALCKLLLREVTGTDPDSCLVILRSLHDLGEIVWYEDSSAGPLQDMVILDPVLVMDVIREVVNHERVDTSPNADPSTTISEDGLMPHGLLIKCHLWRHMDRELVYAFKSLLQYFQVAYSADNLPLDWDSDIVVPTYWKSREDEVHPLPLLQQRSSIQRRGVTPSSYLVWEYELPTELSELIFEQLAVASHTPLLQRSAAWNSCIESTVAGEFVSRLETRQAETPLHDIIRLEVAAEDDVTAWRYLRFYVMAMETVLDRYPGLHVSRHVLVPQSNTEVRHRVSTAAKAIEDAVKLDRDNSAVREVMPWVPPDFSWFIEKAWRSPEVLHRLRTRELVWQTVNKVDVLRRLVIAGEKGRVMPALWTCEYQEDEGKIIVKMLSDLSGICFHVPIEVDVPASFLARYGSWLQNGLSICSNVVPKVLAQPILQKVFDFAQSSLTKRVEHSKQVHNLIDTIDIKASGSYDSHSDKLPPGVAMQMLRDLLKLRDPSFDELQISGICNLECAATVEDGYFVWAHRHEILQLKGLVEICDPGAQLSSTPLATSSLPVKHQIVFRVLAVKGLDSWDWRHSFCEWQLYYGERQTPIEAGKTERHADQASEPTWGQAAQVTLASVTSVEMLQACRLSVQVKRPSRLLGSVKMLEEGATTLRDMVKPAIGQPVPFKIDPIVVPLDGRTPPRRTVTCEFDTI